MRFILFLLFLSTSVQAQQNKKPKLVIGIVVDQMRWDYLYRYSNRYSEKGFKKLMDKGVNYENTFIPYSPSVTAAGHASIYTGSVPALHGIVANDWINRTNEERVYCVADSTVSTVGSFSTAGKMSPDQLNTTTIGDELRLATNLRSRVFGVALKDRGAILPAGRSATAAYWLDDSTGNWITSSWYMNQLPEWVSAYNRNRFIDSLMRNPWNTFFPMATYLQSTSDDVAFEKYIPNERTSTFPHDVSKGVSHNYLPFRYTPYGNTLTFDFARTLITSEKLGKSQTDMLCISLSSTDYIGHKFGVNSIEVEDAYLRLDRDLAAFLSFLDSYCANDYLLFLTADHGASQSSAFLQQQKIKAGSLYTWTMAPELNNFTTQQFGASLVIGVLENQVYINRKKCDSLNIEVQQVKKQLIQYLEKKIQVLWCIDLANIQSYPIPQELKDPFLKGYYSGRSGDLQIVLQPQFTDVNDKGSEHHSVFPYDTHIPLIFFSAQLKPKKIYDKTAITDIAAAVCAILSIQMPNGCIGKVPARLFDYK